MSRSRLGEAAQQIGVFNDVLGEMYINEAFLLQIVSNVHKSSCDAPITLRCSETGIEPMASGF